MYAPARMRYGIDARRIFEKCKKVTRDVTYYSFISGSTSFSLGVSEEWWVKINNDFWKVSITQCGFFITWRVGQRTLLEFKQGHKRVVLMAPTNLLCTLNNITVLCSLFYGVLRLNHLIAMY